MAFEQGLVLESYEAAADLSAKQFYAVTMDNTGKINVATAAKNITGILQNKPASGYMGSVAMSNKGGTSKVAISASTAISIGDLLEVDTGGTLKGVASGTAVARAREALSSVAAVRIIAAELLDSNAAYA